MKMLMGSSSFCYLVVVVVGFVCEGDDVLSSLCLLREALNLSLSNLCVIWIVNESASSCCL